MEQELTEYMETALKITKEAGKVIKFKISLSRAETDHLFSQLDLHVIEVFRMLMLKGFRNAKTIEVKSASWDLVTEYDKRIEKLFVEELSKVYPTHKFIGEESAAEDKGEPELTAAPTWIIDPIDGTTNYVHSFPITCISIGLAIEKVVVMGIVYNPVLEHMFTAIKGRGAFLNSEQIHTSTVKDLSSSLVGYEVSFARDRRITDMILKRCRGLVTKVRGMRAIGSAAVAMCFVAMGSLDGYHIDGLKCWDVAASSIIVQEAGGFVVNTDGSPFDVMLGKILCAGTHQMMREMVACIKEADAS